MAVETLYAYTLLESLPDFEEYITSIRCVGNKSLTSLPKLPGGLIELCCGSNDLLTSLPTLPESLKYMACVRNNLKTLPSLPTTLERLICYTNQLRELPDLPESIKSIVCSDNKIKHIHTLPTKLLAFDCRNNQLTTLSFLPETLLYLQCKGNPFKEPFKSWVDEYDEYANVRGDNMEPLNLLRKRVNSYWTTWVYARDLKNLMVTVGQRELQAQMGNPRDESEDRVQDCLNADCLSVIASFLTGEKGSVIQQRRKLYENGTVAIAGGRTLPSSACYCALV